MHRNNLAHGLLVGEADVMEKAAAQKGVGQFFLIVGGDDENGPLLGLDGLAGLVDKKFHAVEFEQQIIGEFDVGLVDFVDQQNRSLVAFERLP